MAKEKIQVDLDGVRRRQLMRALLSDLRALEAMLENGMIEEGVRRIGAEQEMFLVDPNLRPAPAAMVLLNKLNDPHFVTELGMFNLELNLDAQPFTGDSLSRMERQLHEKLTLLKRVAAEEGVGIVLTGILPTIRKSDLGLENMVPNPRYQALNRAMTELRGGAYEFYIRGVDELSVKHESVMVEACNASFQVHYQVGAAEFARHYNIAQALAGPILAAATNSPLLFGKRLWHETRIALFQQAVDTRSRSNYQRDTSPRVTFGNGWVRKSVTELYREDVTRFRTLVGTDLDEDPMEKVSKGIAPSLRALRLHNGTVYRWVRACYGITDGKPHLRLENRVMPSGPSVLDEMSNAAFWLGLMHAMPKQVEDVTTRMPFEHAKMNFDNAARHGLAATFNWLDGEEISAQKLVMDRLLPMASEGLSQAGISDSDRERYLGTIAKRIGTGRTGSRWLLKSLDGMGNHGTTGERLTALTAALLARQKSERPVADWDLANLDEGGGWKHNYLKVEQYMTTDLVTVHEEDPIDLVANVMVWEKIRHVPVEDSQHRLVGIVSYRALLKLMAEGRLSEGDAPLPAVGEVMKRDPVVVGPEMSTLRAMAIMREFSIGSLPVVTEGRLVGIITEHDFMDIAGQLLEQKLKE